MRPSSRAPVLVLLTLGWVLAAATASAQSAYYLRRGGLLALDPPAANSTAAVVSASLPSGGAALLASFASATLTADVLADGVAADLYLGTGKSGMNGCASISVTLSRTHGTTSTVVATGDLTTSIGPRHDITGPIGVPLTAGQPLLAATGERLVFAVRVANHCAEARTVSLLYDAPERASALAMTPVAPTSTTSTTVLPGASTTSTTTLAPLDCLATAAGLAAVDCRLTRIQEMLQAASPSDLGGARPAHRLARRIRRASTIVRAAELGDARPRRLRRARRLVLRFGAALVRGHVAPAIGGPLGHLAAEAADALGAVPAS